MSPEILEQRILNLAPEMYITKETELHRLRCYHGNTLGPSLFWWITNIPICKHFKGRHRVKTNKVPILSKLSSLDCWEWIILV